MTAMRRLVEFDSEWQCCRVHAHHSLFCHAFKMAFNYIKYMNIFDSRHAEMSLLGLCEQPAKQLHLSRPFAVAWDWGQ